MDEGGCIGSGGKVPWRLAADLQRFKRITMGHCLIMGRKTYESIGRPLPGRSSIVLSRKAGFQAPGCVVVNDFDQALQIPLEAGDDEVFVIGGGNVFSQALPRVDRIYLTLVHARITGDIYFPLLDPVEWIEKESLFTPADESNQFSSTFRIMQRIS